MLTEFLEQVKQADGQETPGQYLGYLTDNILSEDSLKNLRIKPVKKYLGSIYEGSIGEIVGPRGIGKTWLRYAIALSLTRRLNLGPLQCETPAGVLIVDGEMSLNLLKERQALSQHLPAPVKPLDLISNESLHLAGHPVINLSNEKWRNAFLELLKNTGDRYDVIIFDNLSSFLPGTKENDSDAWGPINSFFLKIRWMGKAVIFIHHAGKSGDQRGTSAREDSLDYVLKLTLPAGHDPEEGCRFDATFTKSRRLSGSEAAPFQFRIIDDPRGGLTWAVTNQKESRKELIITLSGHGFTQKAICELLNVDKAYVSRVRTAAIKSKLLNDKATELTPAGLLRYGDVDIEKYTG